MIRLVWSQFGIAFSALLPLVNPIGSALALYGLIGAAPPEVYRRLARRIAINTVLFLLVIELIGAALLSFFGVFLPIMEVAGGLVLASMGWSLLNQQGADAHQQEKEDRAPASDIDKLFQQTFYPLTFPITAGPGCIVIMLTLSAHASTHRLIPDLFAHLGVFIAIIRALCTGVFRLRVCATDHAEDLAPDCQWNRADHRVPAASVLASRLPGMASAVLYLP